MGFNIKKAVSRAGKKVKNAAKVGPYNAAVP